MKEVGDRFGAGDLILPFVLQSAEVMKRAVTRLEDFLDKAEGETKGTVVLATVFGDVHDIGKNLVHTILENNGYTVHNLGKQVPVNTIIEKAQEYGADAIGLSALLVSTSKQMPLCIQELNRRGIDIPVLLGGAAITPSFVRRASTLGDDGQLYGSGAFYCKDAFQGLEAMEALVDPNTRGGFLDDWAKDTREREEKRQDVSSSRSGGTRPPPRSDLPVPEPPFWGPTVLEEIPLSDTLYRLHWGAKNAKGEALDRLVKEEFQPRLERYQREATEGGGLMVRAAYGYFRAAADGDALQLFHHDEPTRPLARFEFPRQTEREQLCLADFFKKRGPTGGPTPATGEHAPTGDPTDIVPLQLVTVAGPWAGDAEGRMEGGDYSEGYFRHGFGVRLAEAGAEYVHNLIRRELGLPVDRGLRYSWGYPACPDVLQHTTVFELLPAEERLDMDLTDAGALVPEWSTAALVVHHPDARYFSV